MSTRRTFFVTAIAALLVASTLPAGVAPAVATPGDSVATDTTAEPPANASTTAAQSADIDVWTAPKDDFADLDDREAVLTAIRDGSLTRDRTVAEGDVAVFAVPASGAFGALDRERADDEPYADAFVDLVTDSGFWFHLNQTNPAPNLARARLDLAATNQNDGLHVVPDERNGTLFVAMRSDRMRLDRGQREGVRVEPGERYEANFTIAESVGLSGGRRTALGNVEFVERSATFETGDDGAIAWSAGNCNRLAGETSVAPGTELTAVVSGENRPFTRTLTLTVATDGTFGATVDTRDLGDNATFTARVRGFPDSDTSGFTANDAGFGRAVVRDQESDGRTVTVGSATLSAGGFVALYPADVLDDIATREPSDDGCVRLQFDGDRAADARLGASGYLDAGETADVQVPLDDSLTETRTVVAIAHRDTNGDRQFDPRTDGPYIVNESLLGTEATISLAANGTTLTTTTSPPTTVSPTTVTTSPTPHPPDTPEPETTTPVPTTTADGPGFGPLAALLALVALVALAAARRP